MSRRKGRREKERKKDTGGRERTCTDVIPIGIIGSKLLEGTSFNDIDPCRNLELS